MSRSKVVDLGAYRASKRSITAPSLLDISIERSSFLYQSYSFDLTVSRRINCQENSGITVKVSLMAQIAGRSERLELSRSLLPDSSDVDISLASIDLAGDILASLEAMGL